MKSIVRITAVPASMMRMALSIANVSTTTTTTGMIVKRMWIIIDVIQVATTRTKAAVVVAVMMGHSLWTWKGRGRLRSLGRLSRSAGPHRRQGLSASFHPHPQRLLLVQRSTTPLVLLPLLRQADDQQAEQSGDMRKIFAHDFLYILL